MKHFVLAAISATKKIIIFISFIICFNINIGRLCKFLICDFRASYTGAYCCVCGHLEDGTITNKYHKIEMKSHRSLLLNKNDLKGERVCSLDLLGHF